MDYIVNSFFLPNSITNPSPFSTERIWNLGKTFLQTDLPASTQNERFLTTFVFLPSSSSSPSLPLSTQTLSRLGFVLHHRSRLHSWFPSITGAPPNPSTLIPESEVLQLLLISHQLSRSRSPLTHFTMTRTLTLSSAGLHSRSCVISVASPFSFITHFQKKIYIHFCGSPLFLSFLSLMENRFLSTS